jgi:hypothetical protein
LIVGIALGSAKVPTHLIPVGVGVGTALVVVLLCSNLIVEKVAEERRKSQMNLQAPSPTPPGANPQPNDPFGNPAAYRRRR